jgi:hypothetical protein
MSISESTLRSSPESQRDWSQRRDAAKAFAGDEIAAQDANTNRSPKNESGSAIRRIFPWLLFILLSSAIYGVARSGLYTPGSDIGYNLGLAGGLMMLALLGYPLRKRLGWMSSAGRVSKWFSLHMVLGVAGPVLILLHCTLQWRSLNAAIAFWCMVVVASSGFLGRYLYRHLHQGLYGRQLTLAEVRTDAAVKMGKTKERLRMEGADDVRTAVERFLRKSAVVETHGWKRPLALAVLGLRARHAQTRLVADARDPRAGQPYPSQEAVDIAVDCIQAVQRSAQFLPYERLFSLWHVLHVPLVLLLILSVIAHIIAVHMY